MYNRNDDRVPFGRTSRQMRIRSPGVDVLFDTIYSIFIILLTRGASILIGCVTSDRLREIRHGRGYATRGSGAATKKKLNVSTVVCYHGGSGEREKPRDASVRFENRRS